MKKICGYVNYWQVSFCSLNKPFFFTMASIESLLSMDIRKSFLSKSMNFFLTYCHTPYKNFVKELAGIDRKLWVMSDMMTN